MRKAVKKCCSMVQWQEKTRTKEAKQLKGVQPFYTHEGNGVKAAARQLKMSWNQNRNSDSIKTQTANQESEHKDLIKSLFTFDRRLMKFCIESRLNDWSEKWLWTRPRSAHDPHMRGSVGLVVMSSRTIPVYRWLWCHVCTLRHSGSLLENMFWNWVVLMVGLLSAALWNSVTIVLMASSKSEYWDNSRTLWSAINDQQSIINH